MFRIHYLFFAYRVLSPSTLNFWINLFILFFSKKKKSLGISVTIGPNFRPRSYLWYWFHVEQDQLKWIRRRVSMWGKEWAFQNIAQVVTVCSKLSTDFLSYSDEIKVTFLTMGYLALHDLVWPWPLSLTLSSSTWACFTPL